MPTLADIKYLIDKTYPTWIKGMMKGYSNDYPSLQISWEKLCEQMNTTPKAIIIVDLIPASEDYILINFFAETLTLAGFIVRRKTELISCYKCGSAIPTSKFYDLLKKNGESIPSAWARSCLSC